MGKQNNKASDKNKQNKKVSTYLILPIALILLIVPLIVHMKEIPISSSAIPFWKGGTSDYDFFSYYKMVWFLIFTVAAVIALVMKFINTNFKIKKTNLYIPMGIYTFFVIISSLVSKTTDVALKGFPNRYEGMFVILAYMVILFVVINLLDNEKQLQIILGGLFISSLIIGLIGMFQFFNMDLFQSGFGKRLMLPIASWAMADSLSFQLGARAVYGTLYHTDYVGSFVAMLFPLSLAVFILAERKKYKISAGILSALMFLCLFASHSRAGLIGAGIAVILLLVFTRKKLLINIKYIGILAVVLVAIVIIVNSVSKGTVANKISTLSNESAPSPTVVAGIKDIEVKKDLVSFSNDQGVLNIGLVKGKMNITDEKGKKVPFEFDSKTNKATFKQPKYEGYVLTILSFNKRAVIQISRNSFMVRLVVTPVGFKLLDNRNQVLDLNPVDRLGFKGHEDFASARGYIWSRSLPLLKNTVIVGYGPDTFAIHFPQSDYMGKLLAYGDTSIVVDKPHNLYLNTGLSTGIISLIALLAIFIMYIIFSARIYFRREFNTLFEIVGCGIFAAICGYLIAGLANDSTVSVSPVFWILLGAGISINMALRTKESIE